MKLKLHLTIFLISILTAAVAEQQPERTRRCYTTENINRLKTLNPGLEQQMILDEENLQKYLMNMESARTSGAIHTIPVVVHVVYKTPIQNISDAQIESQIDVLNEDFARLNADTVNTPAAFASVASETDFRFCLAKRKPDGSATNGIERRLTTVNSFSLGDDVKFFASGGLDAWDTDKYLNIWVCNLGGGILGWAEPPATTHTDTYGAVIAYDCFGRVGTLDPDFNLGRTASHEIGHCFNLSHIWEGPCGSSGDNISDTPDQDDASYGCLTFPATDICSPTTPGIMFMNYMDYSDDDCLNTFTFMQSNRMTGSMNTYYSSLYTSDGCDEWTSVERLDEFNFSIYPNPSAGFLNLDMFTTKNIGNRINVKLTDVMGKLVSETVLHNPVGLVHQIDVSGNADGVYFITLYNENYQRTERISIQN